MKTLLLCILTMFLMLNKTVKAQDTLYFEANRKKTASKNAVYTRIIAKSDSVYSVKLYKRGSLVSIKEYKDKALKILHGRTVSYYENGRIDSEGWCENNKRAGDWTFYYDNQQISGLVSFRDGKILKAVYFSSDGNLEPPSHKAEAKPAYPGGVNNYTKYIKENLRYPAQSRRNKVSGIVKIAFTVSRTGEVIDPKVISGVNDELNEEALRVIGEMPDWQPGRQFNRPVNVRYVLPIIFALTKTNTGSF